MSTLLVFVLSLPPAIAFMAVVEYLMHYYPMHRLAFAKRFPFGYGIFERHGVLHHGHYFHNYQCETNLAAKYVSMTLDPVANNLGLSPVTALVYWSISPVAAATLVLVVAFHAIAWSFVHTQMHYPTYGWLKRVRLYRYMRDYHYTHHLHPGSNYCAVFPPVMDWLCGTYRGTTKVDSK